MSRVLRYKFDILKELKEQGYSTYKLQKEQILSHSTVQKLRSGEIVGTANIDVLCSLLHCQPGDLIEHIPN